MSETDDTDVLLLIPPDFFLVRTSSSEDSLLESSRTVVQKPLSCTAQVLGKLVNQVHSLENRLGSLELINTSGNLSSFGTIHGHSYCDTDSFDEHSVDSKFFTFPRRRRRKVKTKKNINLSLISSDSTKTKSAKVPSLKLRNFEIASIDTKISDLVSESPSMDGELSSIMSTPSKKTDNLLLHEIDEFLTKVEAYESPESKFKDHDQSIGPESVIKATADYISQKLDCKNGEDQIQLPSGRTVNSNVLDKYIYLVRNKSPSTSRNNQSGPSTSAYKNSQISENSNTKQHIENSRSAMDKSPSIRKLNFSENKDIQPTSTPKGPQVRASSNHFNKFHPTSNKIYDRASKVLEQYKLQSQSNSNQNPVTDSYFASIKKEEFKMPQMRPYELQTKDAYKLAMQNKFLDTVDTDLLSLSELWGDKGDAVDRDRQNNKLEEERLKREHCESLIQDLQKNILEQQEKLAVAMRVDRAKDGAIAKLKDAWLKLSNSLDRAEERHKAALDNMVREVSNFKAVASDAQKKTNHYEVELYKALDLAHDFQDKCKQLTTEKKELQMNMEKISSSKDEIITTKDKEIQILKENYETIMRLNKQSTDCVKNLEDVLEKEKCEHELTKRKVNELNHKIQAMNEETSIIMQERDIQKDRVNEERARCNVLEKQLCEKQNFASELVKKCETLETEVKSLRKHLELQKNELKVHYQKQLEDAVLCKLQEFQAQLDQAEREMENEAKSKEAVIMDGFNKQFALMQEQHKLEVNVMEEKQKEEIKLYRLQLAQASEKISLLESKLESYRRRRTQMASQLHGVMEAQWRQAVRILTQPAAPAQPADSVSTPIAQDYAPPKLPSLSIPHLDRGSVRSEDDRERRAPELFNFDNLSDNELQQYVKLLLTKPPNLDGSGDNEIQKQINEEPTSDRPDKDRSKDKVRRNINKPPWKA